MVTEGMADAAHACPISSYAYEWEAAPYGLYYLPMDPEDKAAWKRLGEIAPFMNYPIWTDYGAMGIDGPKWLAGYGYAMTTYDFVDEQVIYTIVKALDEGYDLFKAVCPPTSETWNMEFALDLAKPVHIPFHPGFIKYAKEKGMWTTGHEKWQAEVLKTEEERIAAWKPKE